MSATETALMAPWVMADPTADNAFLQTVADGLSTRSAMPHSTIRIETGGEQHTGSGIDCLLF